MTAKEKLMNLKTGKNLGSVPFFRPILMNFAAHHIGKKYSDFAEHHEVLAEANLKCMEDFGTDAVGLVSDPYRETSAFGAEITFPEDDVPRCAAPIIKSLKDARDLRVPDTAQAERTRDRIQAAEKLRETLGGSVPIIGWIEGPMAEACDLAGVSEMLIKTASDEIFTETLLSKTGETAARFAEEQILAGCDVIGIGDAICSQISAEMFRRFEKDRLRRLIRFIQDQGALVKLHICGNITHLLKDIAETGPDIVDIDSMVDMEDAYRQLGPEIIRSGNINPVEIEKLTATEVYKAAENLCRRERGRRFILSAGCEITVKTPPENLRAMRDALYNVYAAR